MDSRIFLRFVFSFIFLLASSPAQGSFQRMVLDAFSGRVGEGSGSINGAKTKVFTLHGFTTTEDFVKGLRTVFAGKATVSLQTSSFGDSVMVLKLRSAECPKCPKFDRKKNSDVFRDALFFSLFQTQNGLIAIGSSAVIGQMPKGRILKYPGEVLKRSTASLKGTSEVAMTFAKASLVTYTGTTSRGLKETYADLEQDLRGSGFSPFGADAENAHEENMGIFRSQEVRAGIWSKGNRVIRVSATRLSQQNLTLVAINEVES